MSAPSATLGGLNEAREIFEPELPENVQAVLLRRVEVLRLEHPTDRCGGYDVVLPDAVEPRARLSCRFMVDTLVAVHLAVRCLALDQHDSMIGKSGNDIGFSATESRLGTKAARRRCCSKRSARKCRRLLHASINERLLHRGFLFLLCRTAPVGLDRLGCQHDGCRCHRQLHFTFRGRPPTAQPRKSKRIGEPKEDRRGTGNIIRPPQEGAVKLHVSKRREIVTGDRWGRDVPQGRPLVLVGCEGADSQFPPGKSSERANEVLDDWPIPFVVPPVMVRLFVEPLNSEVGFRLRRVAGQGVERPPCRHEHRHECASNTAPGFAQSLLARIW